MLALHFSFFPSLSVSFQHFFSSTLTAFSLEYILLWLTCWVELYTLYFLEASGLIWIKLCNNLYNYLYQWSLIKKKKKLLSSLSKLVSLLSEKNSEGFWFLGSTCKEVRSATLVTTSKMLNRLKNKLFLDLWEERAQGKLLPPRL